MIESGNVHLPLDVVWASAFVTEAERFPNATHNDQVDMTSQALMRLRKKRKRKVDVWSTKL